MAPWEDAIKDALVLEPANDHDVHWFVVKHTEEDGCGEPKTLDRIALACTTAVRRRKLDPSTIVFHSTFAEPKTLIRRLTRSTRAIFITVHEDTQFKNSWLRSLCKGAGSDFSQAVSYTHLTLPTICSV